MAKVVCGLLLGKGPLLRKEGENPKNCHVILGTIGYSNNKTTTLEKGMGKKDERKFENLNKLTVTDTNLTGMM